MIIRIIVVDPRPREPADELLVYQVPEKSRAFELLCELFDAAKLEYVLITSAPGRKKKIYTPGEDLPSS